MNGSEKQIKWAQEIISDAKEKTDRIASGDLKSHEKSYYNSEFQIKQVLRSLGWTRKFSSKEERVSALAEVYAAIPTELIFSEVQKSLDSMDDAGEIIKRGKDFHLMSAVYEEVVKSLTLNYINN